MRLVAQIALNIVSTSAIVTALLVTAAVSEYPETAQHVHCKTATDTPDAYQHCLASFDQ